MLLPLSQCGWSADVIKASTSDGQHFLILERIDYTALSGKTISLEPGDGSDGASDPRLLWDLIPPFGWYWPEAYLHDKLYRATQEPKDECDSLFLEAMLRRAHSLKDRIEANGLYMAVHLFGRDAFNADRRVA